MTTPALEKAAAVIEQIERDGHRFLDRLEGYEESRLISYIAQAITQAENDKLEEAALWFEEQAKIVKGRPYLKEFPASLSDPICEILDGIPADLRSLIQKD